MTIQNFGILDGAADLQVEIWPKFFCQFSAVMWWTFAENFNEISQTVFEQSSIYWKILDAIRLSSVKGTPIPESEYSSSLGFFVSRRILTKLGGYGPWGHTWRLAMPEISFHPFKGGFGGGVFEPSIAWLVFHVYGPILLQFSQEGPFCLIWR